MSGLVNMERLELISRLRGEIQDMLDSRLKIKMFICDLLEEHPGENAVEVLFASESESREAAGPSPPCPSANGSPQEESPGSGTNQAAILVGKHRDFHQFLNKEGPFYEEEFMLELEFNYGTGVCTVHLINLPGRLRNKGLGSAIAAKSEQLALAMGMETIFVPSEHRATAFWLRNGYLFEIAGEKAFYEKNRDKPNLYVAYDLRKRIAG